MSKLVSVRVKVWLVADGKPLIGEGGYQLLTKIAQTKSLKRAAEELGLSYAFAWRYLKRIESLTGKKVVETRRGGLPHGGAVLTEFGFRLIKMYEEARSAAENAVKNVKADWTI